MYQSETTRSISSYSKMVKWSEKALASFAVAKIGVEDLVVNAATSHSLLYGLTVVSMALFTGWLASIVFRRD